MTDGVKVPIHSEESLRVLKQILNGGGWVWQIMKNELYPAFKQEPGRYRELKYVVSDY